MQKRKQRELKTFNMTNTPRLDNNIVIVLSNLFCI